jgi:predicted secreted protein
MKLAVLSAVAALLVAACATPAATTPVAPAAAPAAAAAPRSPDPVSAQPPAGTQANAVPGVELTNATDGRKVTVRRGGEVKLVLDLNGIYELAWEMEKKVEPTLSPIGERIYVTNGRNSNPYDVLAGGYSIYRFRAEQPGTVALQLSKHSRADGKTLATVHYDVTVE